MSGERAWPEARAVVLDLDGTLVDSREDIARACNHALQSLGRPPLPTAIVKTMIGDGARVLLSRALGLPPEDPVVAGALEPFLAFYDADPVHSTHVLPWARETLEAAKARGVPALLCTNKPRKTSLLVVEKLGLAPLLADVWAAGDGPLKPDPAGVAVLLARARAPAAHAWVVGDGPQDVLAGREAGCFTVAVRGFADDAALRATNPDALVDDLEPVARALQGQRS